MADALLLSIHLLCELSFLVHIGRLSIDLFQATFIPLGGPSEGHRQVLGDGHDSLDRGCRYALHLENVVFVVNLTLLPIIIVLVIVVVVSMGALDHSDTVSDSIHG